MNVHRTELRRDRQHGADQRAVVMADLLRTGRTAPGELGWMTQPPGSSNYVLMDEHGAGAQRSDPKTGDPANYPHGSGPQGDVIHIYNHVRLVRGGNVYIPVELSSFGAEQREATRNVRLSAAERKCDALSARHPVEMTRPI